MLGSRFLVIGQRSVIIFLSRMQWWVQGLNPNVFSWGDGQYKELERITPAPGVHSDGVRGGPVD